MTTPEQFRALLGHPEGSRVEFKSATGGFHFEKLVTYCVALANEGGGTIVLGVTYRRPRQVVGALAFTELRRSPVPRKEPAGLQPSSDIAAISVQSAPRMEPVTVCYRGRWL